MALELDARSQESADERVEQLADACGELYAAGELAAATILVPRIQSLAELSDDSPRIVWALNYLGLLRSAAGDREGAIRLFQRMREMADKANDAGALGTALQNLGIQSWAHEDLSSAEDAFRRSLKIRESLGDWRGQAQIRVNLAGMYEGSGRLDAAQIELAEAEKAIGARHDPHLRASTSGVHGHVAVALGEFAGAEAWFRRSLVFARRLADQVIEGTALQNLVAISIEQTKYEAAARWARSGIRVARRIGSERHEEPFQRALGGVLFRKGDLDGSERHLKIAAALSELIGDEHAHASALADLGAMLADRGDYQEALGLLVIARRIFQRLDDQEWLTPVLQNLRETHAALGESSKAIAVLRSEIKRESDRARVGSLRERFGGLLLDERRDRAAILNFRKAINCYRGVEGFEWQHSAVLVADRLDAAGLSRASVQFYDEAIAGLQSDSKPELAYQFRNDRAVALARSGRLDLAATDLQQIAREADELENRVIKADALLNLGEIERRRGRLEAARSSLEQVESLARDLGNAVLQGDALVGLGLASLDGGNWEAAATYARRALDIGGALKSRSLRGRALAALARSDIALGRRKLATGRLAKAAEMEEAAGTLGQAIEDYAALAESLAIVRRQAEIAPVVQKLVDLAQAIRQEPMASESLIRTAGLVMELDRKLAADLFATSMVLAAASSRDQVIEAIATAAILMYRTLREHPKGDARMTAMVRRRLQRQLGAAFETVDRVLTAAALQVNQSTTPNAV